MLTAAFIIVLVLFLPVTFLPLALDQFFSQEELTEMGVRTENLRA
jgi:hypothetical protein